MDMTLHNRNTNHNFVYDEGRYLDAARKAIY